MRTHLPLFLLYLQTCAFASEISVRGRSLEALVNKRFVCNNDNVLRALKANSGSASPFCSSLIDIPVSTIFKSVPSVTATTITTSSTRVSTIIPNFPSPLPTYISQYSTAQVSSACSCLSVRTSTDTETASVSTVYSRKTVYSTTTATGPCATGTIYPGAHLVTGQFADAYNYTITGSDPYECCIICNNPAQGAFSSCVAWAYDYSGNGNCFFVLEGGPYADYMKPPCAHDGLQPGTIYVDKVKYPRDVGGKGQCASTVTIVNG